MKQLFLLSVFSFSVSFYAQQSKSNVELESKDKVRYAKGQSEPFSGKLIRYYENGNIEAEAVLVEGKFYGPEICYFENGNKRSHMYYRKDIPHGKFQLWNEDGKLSFEGYFKDGLLYKEDKLFTGTINCFYKNGKLFGKIDYKNGKRDGEEKWYTRKRELIVEYYYGNGKLLNMQIHKKNNIHLKE